MLSRRGGQPMARLAEKERERERERESYLARASTGRDSFYDPRWRKYTRSIGSRDTRRLEIAPPEILAEIVHRDIGHWRIASAVDTVFGCNWTFRRGAIVRFPSVAAWRTRKWSRKILFLQTDGAG